MPSEFLWIYAWMYVYFSFGKISLNNNSLPFMSNSSQRSCMRKKWSSVSVNCLPFHSPHLLTCHHLYSSEATYPSQYFKCNFVDISTNAFDLIET